VVIAGVAAGVTLDLQPDAQRLAHAAADFICAGVRAKPDLSILVATGKTPMPTYAELARRVAAGQADFGRVTAIQLDEYLGITGDDPRSLWRWMERAFVAPLGITRTVRLDTPEHFDREIAALGGIDLAILGLGLNGHLGFNEPPSLPDAPTRTVTLTSQSLESNRAYWNGLPVPIGAVTAGMHLILSACQTLLLVSGAHKRAVLRRTLEGPQTPDARCCAARWRGRRRPICLPRCCGAPP
jgi:glucosamine-6-phosphate deaminase